MAADDGFLSRWSRRKSQARAADTTVEPASDTPPDAQAPDDAPMRAAVPRAATPSNAPEAASPPVLESRRVQGASADASSTSLSTKAPTSPSTEAPTLPSTEASIEAPTAASVPGEAAVLPTLDDVARLTPEADFSAFVDRAVAPEVRNAAMKKLFTDPHFNVMDGLDVYIDDYNKADPLPRQWLRQMMQARALGLLDDEVTEQPRPEEWHVGDPSSAGKDSADGVVEAGADETDAAAADASEADAIDGAVVDDVGIAQASDVGAPGAGDGQPDPAAPVAGEAHASNPDPTPPARDNPAAHEDPDLPLQRDDAAGPGGADPRAGGEPGRA